MPSNDIRQCERAYDPGQRQARQERSADPRRADQVGQQPPYAREIKLVGKATVIYSPDCPLLKCRARMMIRDAGVKIIH